MRVFQEEIFGPVLAVTTFTDAADALAIANDTLYGLGAGVWTRDGTRAYKTGRGIRAGRVCRTATTNTPLARRSAATRSPASAGRTTESCSTTTARPRTFWSATAPSRSGCSEPVMSQPPANRVSATAAARQAISRLRAAW